MFNHIRQYLWNNTIPTTILNLYVLTLLAVVPLLLFAIPLLVSKYVTQAALYLFEPLMLSGVASCVIIGWLAHRTISQTRLSISTLALCASDFLAAVITILPVLFLVKAGLWATFESIPPIVMFALLGQSIALCATRRNPTRLWGSASFGLAATLALTIAGVRFDAQPVSTIATVITGVAGGIVLLDSLHMLRNYRTTLQD